MDHVCMIPPMENVSQKVVLIIHHQLARGQLLEQMLVVVVVDSVVQIVVHQAQKIIQVLTHQQPNVERPAIIVTQHVQRAKPHIPAL